MSKHSLLEIEDNGFSYERNRQSIAREAALDGIYVIRTNVAEENLSAADIVRQYKQLSAVEHAFRSWKSADLKVRPIHIIWPIGYVRMCFCACWPTTRNGICVRRWAPLLFAGADPETGEARRNSRPPIVHSSSLTSPYPEI